MAKPKIYGPAARQRINRAVTRDEARADGAPLPGPPAGRGRLPRTYRRFTLTEQLDAGGDATVEWDDGTTGTVYDRDTCCWGLEGETGEAAAYPDESGGVEWRVTKNPGQGTYKGTLADAETAAGDVDVEIEIDGSTITLSAALVGDPGTDKQWPDGSTVFVGHFRGDWVIVAIWACPEDEP